MTIEHEMNKKVGILLDGIAGIQTRFERQDEVERRVETLETDMAAVKMKLKAAGE